MVIGNIIRNIFSESEGGGSLLQQEIDRVVEDCIDDDDGNERSQGKHNITRTRQINGDDGNDDEDYD
jgi:hypothetical protein